MNSVVVPSEMAYAMFAYLSDESGRVEVYVDAFPVPRHKYRVTDNGGFSAHWQKGGRELAVVSADLRSVVVDAPDVGYRVRECRAAGTGGQATVHREP